MLNPLNASLEKSFHIFMVCLMATQVCDKFLKGNEIVALSGNIRNAWPDLSFGCKLPIDGRKRFTKGMK